MRTRLLLWYLLSLVMTCPMMGQVQPKPVTKADYALWHRLTVASLSAQGNWVSYHVAYENGADTLFVKHTKTLRTHAVAGGQNGRFVKEQYFICMDSAGRLLVTELSSGKQEVTTGIQRFEVTGDGRFLIVLGQQETEPTMTVRSLTGKTIMQFTKVTTFSYHEGAQAVVFDSDGVLTLLSLKAPYAKTVIATKLGTSYDGFAWSKDGTALAFICKDTITTVGYYQIATQKLVAFPAERYATDLAGMSIYQSSFTPLAVADDGRRVFFGLQDPSPLPASTGLQIWNTADKELYLRRQITDNGRTLARVAFWEPETARFSLLTDSTYTNAMLTGHQQYALLYHPMGHEPQPEQRAPVDYYLKDLNSGSTRMLLEKHSPIESKLVVSQRGGNIAYFKDGHWWAYATATGLHHNLTLGSGLVAEDENYDRSGPKRLCGFAGWTTDGGLLVYDTYDVWLLRIGDKAQRLTRGREARIVFRVETVQPSQRKGINFSGADAGVFDLAAGLFMIGKGSSANGYYQWTREKGLSSLFISSNRLSQLQVSQDGKVIAFTEEHYHLPPRIVSLKIGKSISKVIFETNNHQKKFAWGFSKLISYTNSAGRLLKGALFYPAGYDPEQQYPMVVKVYERPSDAYNHYENPSSDNSEGFNISNFTTRGYFVLLPDIVYEEGNTGRSALDCVLSACKEVLTHEVVDAKRIGLFGHSFGGYETNFIITQTDFFAAAVSGSGVSDYVSDYLSVGLSFGTTNYFRYETDQSRMGVPLFEDRERYYRNSPMSYVEQVRTPLLLWSGTNDKMVPYLQGLEFHMALRRLQKPNILLLYEGEGHSLGQRKHKEDLTERFEAWFDYYLKDGKQPEWFKPNQL